MRKIGLFLCAIFLVLACNCNNSKIRYNNLTSSIIDICREFNIAKFSYIICDQKEVIDKDFRKSEDICFNQSAVIIENFAAPLTLKQLIDNSNTDEDNLLIKYIPSIKDSSLKIADLIKVPSNQAEIDPLNRNQICSYINNVIKITGKNHNNFSTDRFVMQSLKLNNSNSRSSKSLLNNIAQISHYFDQKNISGQLPTDGMIKNPFPTWYTRNINYFAGWYVLKFDGHTIFWNYFRDGNNSLLLMKMIDTGIFIALDYTSTVVTSPLDYNKLDLLQSPFATALLTKLFVPDQLIKAGVKEIKNSKWNFLFMNDLISRAKTYDRMGKQDIADSLYKIYKEYFPGAIPIKYLKQNVLADIGYVPNNFSSKKFFKLDKETKVRLFGSGQSLVDPYVDSHLNCRDGIELYLDPLNNKEKTFNINNKHCLFRFNYLYNKISGSYLSCKDIQFSFSDPQDSVYMLTIKIPWNTLGIMNPRSGRTIGLNMYIIDNDMDTYWRKSVLYWSSKDCNDPSSWGKLVLTDRSSIHRNNTAFCCRVNHPLILGGDPGNLWSNAFYYSVDSVREGSISSKRDNSACFKTLWDDQYLYFLFVVGDNVKQRPEYIATDMGWIEDANTGEVICKTNATPDKYSFPTTITDKTLTLKSGKYFLSYFSDGSHSIEKWYGKPPQNGLYGVTLYEY